MQHLEVFQTQFFKHSLKVHGKTPNAYVLGELGKFKLERYVKTRMLNFWVNVCTGKSTKFSTVMYKFMKGKFDKNEVDFKWFKCIKETLNDIGLDHILNGNIENDLFCTFLQSDDFKKKINNGMTHYYSEMWEKVLESSDSYNFYHTFKKELVLESYLIDIEPRYAIPLTKFRCENHKLPNVIGRYTNVDAHLRICNLCDLGDKGDNYHYLFNCSFFKKQRENLLKDSIDQLQGRLTSRSMKIKNIMNSKSETHLVNLSKFVTIVMDHFDKAKQN